MITEQRAYNIFNILIFTVLLFGAYSELVPLAQDSGQKINDNNLPLGGLFSYNGALFGLIMAGLVITILTLFLTML